jgi:trehalose/maltose hydrolase-like predicted phosphorylase
VKVWLVVLASILADAAQNRRHDSSFVLTATDLAPYTRSYLGNGFFSTVTHQLGTRPAESYMIRVYDHTPDDVARIAVLPAWNEVDFYNGQRWLNDTALESRSLDSWRQTLDMYDGVLLTRYDWVDGEKRTSVEVRSFVSRSNPYLAAIKVTVVPRYSGTVKVLLPIRSWPSPARFRTARIEKLERDSEGRMPNVRYPGHMLVEERQVESGLDSALVRVSSRAEGSVTLVTEAMVVTWPKELRDLKLNRVMSGDLTGVEVEFEATAGTPYSFCKYVGAVPSFASATPAEAARQVSTAAAAREFDAVFQDHAAAWHEIWKTDILVEGDPELQRVIHAAQFYLYGSVREGTGFNIPPMGLSSSGYSGHIFWDSDIFMYPALLPLHPEMARSAAMFRSKTLGAAMTNARVNGYKGAMYPWEADETGAEATPRFAWDNALGENHVTSDVALAQWQYYLATGDRAWLAAYGYPVLKETADYWVSRCTYNREKNRYEIRKVVSPDEGSRGVDNDVATNVGARKTLELAMAASKLLGKPENPDWRGVRDKMYVLYDAEGQFFPEYEGAPAWRRNVGHVTTLIDYPFEYPMTLEAKRNTLENALKSITSTGGGAFLLPTLYPVVAAEIGDQAVIDDCLRRSYGPYLKPPFDVLNEGTRGESVNFLTGTGLLQQFIYGYTGLRLSEEGVTEKFKPVLPSSIKKLTLRNITIRGKKFDAVVEGSTLKLSER